MNTDDIRKLYGFNTWANHKILGGCQAVTPQEFTRNLGTSFESVRGTLVHIMGAEWLWLQRWLGDSPREMLQPGQFPNLSSIESRWITLQQEQLAFIATLTDGRLQENLSYTNLRGQQAEFRIG